MKTAPKCYPLLVGLTAFAVVSVPTVALSQALTSLSSLRTGYNTRKATVRPEGALKAQIDAIDQQMATASRLGQTGEVRRLLAKGQALLAGREWTDELDFANSVVLRTNQVMADSTRPYTLRLEQIYRPSIELQRALTARVSIRRPQAAAAGRGAQAPAAPAIVKDLGSFEGVSRDLRESPYALDLDVHDVPDGTYQFTVEMLDGTRALGTSTLMVNLRKGLDEIVAGLEADAKKAPESMRADILFPVDRMRHVNAGAIEMRTFSPDADFATAQAVAASARSGKDYFAGKTGDFKRHHFLKSANEILPYRVYVPKNYNPSRTYPLIIALHGLGGTEDSFFTGYNGQAPKMAEERGYLIAAPLGYRVDGGYGWGIGNPPADSIARARQENSEADVMAVLAAMKQNYKVDENRIYLMGHSMGGIGTWRMAPKYPEIWAAIAPFAGSGSPDSLTRIKHIPEIVVHGDDDRTVNVRGSRTMVEKMKELGIEHKYIEVPGGSHGDVVAPNIPAVFDFFDAHKRGTRANQ